MIGVGKPSGATTGRTPGEIASSARVEERKQKPRNKSPTSLTVWVTIAQRLAHGFLKLTGHSRIRGSSYRD